MPFAIALKPKNNSSVSAGAMSKSRMRHSTDCRHHGHAQRADSKSDSRVAFSRDLPQRNDFRDISRTGRRRRLAHESGQGSELNRAFKLRTGLYFYIRWMF